jgi:hypothetical protein
MPALAYAAASQHVDYRVRPGDTLSAIAGRECGDPGDFLALAYNNGVANPDVIYARQVLRVACRAALAELQARYPGWFRHDPARGAAAPSPRASDPPAVVTSVSGTFGCASLEALWDSAGGNPGEAFTAAEIATAESGGRSDAISPTDDFGLWQINAGHGPALATLNPEGNARAAVLISDDGRDWNPWTTYREGLYIGRC